MAKHNRQVLITECQNTEKAIDNTVAVKAAVDHYVSIFENLTPQTIDELLVCFSEQAHFVDPFNDVTGKADIKAIFVDMFEKVQNPRFVVDDIFISDNKAMLTWVFYFQFNKQIKTISIRGCSQVCLDEYGKVILHEDFWDPCHGLYEHVPMIGGFFRWLRRRLSVKT